ncbi:isochorismatase family protein [Pararhizobium sp. LjRoot255]|uniref:isochorismatase family protein n=1 Tax=Pararhizobium sp. LjRoot255 TaxID=3342298 RepID=UPI003ECE7889
MVCRPGPQPVNAGPTYRKRRDNEVVPDTNRCGSVHRLHRRLGVFSEASGLVATLAPLKIIPDAVFRKRRHSALVGSGLDVWLTGNGICRVIISGSRTEQCCETTTRHASDLGYAVDYVGEATLTFPMTDPAGRSWSATEIRARTELVLAGRFARLATVEEALAGPAEKIAA